jgi:multidrug efflux system membrane fusion protein
MKVQLTYYTITSPIDGRAGAIALKEGNNVKANDTLTLVTINQLHPIYVAFSVPENQLPEIRRMMAAHSLEVTAQASGESAVETGKLAFFDNSVDTTTGTIMLRGIFDNAGNRLWPGQFVNVSLILRIDPDALVVPSQAVQIGQSSSYVYVIKPDKTVEPRTVKVSRSGDGESVIASGLKAGEQVVVDGQLRLDKDSIVEPRPASKEAGGAAS